MASTLCQALGCAELPKWYRGLRARYRYFDKSRLTVPVVSLLVIFSHRRLGAVDEETFTCFSSTSCSWNHPIPLAGHADVYGLECAPSCHDPLVYPDKSGQVPAPKLSAVPRALFFWLCCCPPRLRQRNSCVVIEAPAVEHVLATMYRRVRAAVSWYWAFSSLPWLTRFNRGRIGHLS